MAVWSSSRVETMCRGCIATDFSDHFYLTSFWVATVPLVADLGRHCLHPPACTQPRWKATCIIVSGLLMAHSNLHTSRNELGAWVEWAMVPEGRKLLKCTQLHHQGEFRHVSISARRQPWQCSQNLRGSFLIAVLSMKVSGQAIAAD